MESKDKLSKLEEQGPSKTFNSNNNLNNLKNDYFIRKLFEYMIKGRTLKIINIIEI